MSDELVELTIKLPKPPEGWEWDGIRQPKFNEPYWTRGKIFISGSSNVEEYICCRRIEPPWKPPAGAADGVTFFPCGEVWFATNGKIYEPVDEWHSLSGYVYATIFRDFVPPPERRPYTVGKDC